MITLPKPKWKLHVPLVGADDEAVVNYYADQEDLLDGMIDTLVTYTALEPRVEWL